MTPQEKLILLGTIGGLGYTGFQKFANGVPINWQKALFVGITVIAIHHLLTVKADS